MFLFSRSILHEKHPVGSYFCRLLYAGIYCIVTREMTILLISVNNEH